MADMPWREAILTALQDSGTPMHYAEIAQAIIDRGYRVNVGATPAATVSANLSGLPRGGRDRCVQSPPLRGDHSPPSEAVQPPLLSFGHTGVTSFQRHWEKLSFVFELPDQAVFPAIGIDEDKREIAERFVRMCRRMADFTVVNEDATLLVWEAAEGWNIAIVNHPTDEMSLGTSAVFRQLHNEQEEASFSRVWNALSKVASALPEPHRTERISVLKKWKTVRAELTKHTLQSLTAAKVSGAELDTDPAVSFGNIKPDNLIRLFNYGDTLHFGDKRQELVSLLEDGFDEAYFRYGALISILGLSQLYFGFAVLVDAALGGVACHS
jgi:hypothetical protein